MGLAAPRAWALVMGVVQCTQQREGSPASTHSEEFLARVYISVVGKIGGGTESG